MRACATLAVLFAASLTAADDKKADKPAIKQIETKDLKIKVGPPDKGKPTEPTEVTEANQLPKVGPLTPDAVKAVEKQIDFSKEKLVVFWWGGSGQDKLAAGDLKTADKKTTATFTYSAGRTRDYRGHFAMFVVPKDAEVKVELAGK